MSMWRMWGGCGMGAAHGAAAAVLAAVLWAGGEAAAGTGDTVALWTFNGPSGTTSPAQGSGTATLFGGTTQNFTQGTTTDKHASQSTDNKAWTIGSFPSTAVGSGTRGVMFQCLAPAGTGVVISWSQRNSASSSRWFRFEYTLDGTAFTSAGVPNEGLLEASAGADAWMNDRSIDLTKVAGIAGNPKFAFRITSVFAPGADYYVPTSPTGSYSPLGTVRFDLVHVTAAPVPGPAASSLIGLAALGARRGGALRRRPR